MNRLSGTTRSHELRVVPSSAPAPGIMCGFCLLVWWLRLRLHFPDLNNTHMTNWVMQLSWTEVSGTESHLEKVTMQDHIRVCWKFLLYYVFQRLALAAYVVPKLEMCSLFCPYKCHISIIFCYVQSQQSYMSSSVTPSLAACRRNHSGKPHSIPPSWPKVCHTFSHGISSAEASSPVHFESQFLSIIVLAVKEYACPHSADEYARLHSADLGPRHDSENACV